MSNDQVTDMINLLYEMRREQGIILEKVSTLHENSNWLEGRVDRLEEKTQALGWFRHAKNLTLWVAAIMGGISAVVTLVGKIR